MKNCTGSCRLTAGGVAVPGKSDANIDDEQPANLNAYFKGMPKRQKNLGWYILFGKNRIPFTYFPPTILDMFRQILLNVPCHKCHIAILKPVLIRCLELSPFDERHGHNSKNKFMAQLLENLRSNVKTFDEEIVALSVRLLWLFKLSKDCMKKFVSELKLSPIMPRVFTHYLGLWSCREDNHREVMEDFTFHLLEARLKETFDENDRTHEDVMFEAMVAFCSHNIRSNLRWSYIVCPFFRRVMLWKSEWLEVWVSCDSYTHKLHSTLEWKSDSTFAMQYILHVVNIISTAFHFERYNMRPRQEGDEAGNSWLISKYFEQIIARLLEVLRKVEAHDSIKLILETINEIQWVVKYQDERVPYHPLDLDFVSELSDIWALRIQEILEDENGDLDHDRKPDKLYTANFPNRFKYSDSAEKRKQDPDKSDEAVDRECRIERLIFDDDDDDNGDDDDDDGKFLRKMLEDMCRVMKEFHLNKRVRTANFNFLNAIIRAARFRSELAYEGPLVILEEIVIQNLSDTETILTSGIPQTIFTNINNLHYNCDLCVELCKSVYNPMLELMRPKGKVDFNSERSAELAMSLPYVIANKYQLVDVMYPEGFDLLASSLGHGQGIESLYLVAQILQSKTKRQWKSSICLSELSEPIHEDDPGAKIFVLDDGTRIRARTAPLVQNSSFFSILLDGRFAEATCKEIRISDATPFQFCFLVNFTTAVDELAPKTKLKFELDFQTHLDLYECCNKFLMEKLCDSLADSMMRFMTPETLPKIYQSGMMHACGSLRLMCMDFALRIFPVEQVKMLEKLFGTLDNKVLADDAMKWMMRESIRIRRRSRYKIEVATTK